MSRKSFAIMKVNGSGGGSRALGAGVSAEVGKKAGALRSLEISRWSDK